MEFIADILLISGAFAAAVYCVVLSRRLRRFTDLEKGVGGAIAVLSAQVDDMTKTLKSAQNSAAGSVQSLAGLTERAEGAARRLELLVAALHDLPSPGSVQQPQQSQKQPQQIRPAQAAPAPQESAPSGESPTDLSAASLFQSRRGQTQEAV